MEYQVLCVHDSPDTFVIRMKEKNKLAVFTIYQLCKVKDWAQTAYCFVHWTHVKKTCRHSIESSAQKH